MKNDIFLTLSQAAKETGRSKSTISKAIDTGKLSYIEKTTAGYKLDPSEVFRVFPMPSNANGENAKIEQSRTHSNDLENDFLKRENTLLREQVERERERVEREREQADYWRQTATMLLSHRPEPPEIKPTGNKEDSPLWRKLFGRGK